MRLLLIIVGAFAAIVSIEKPAEAYNGLQWCAYYNFQHGGATNCGFATWQQCQDAISRRVLRSQSHVPAPTRNVSLD